MSLFALYTDEVIKTMKNDKEVYTIKYDYGLLGDISLMI